MIDRRSSESQLWQALARQHLADLSQFHRDRFFDEVPLVSRESDLAFLAGAPPASANSILMGFALKFLKAVVSYETHPPNRPFLAAITVRDIPESRWIIPSLFVWSGPLLNLRRSLHLGEASTPFAKKVKKLVRETHLLGPFDILDEVSDGLEEERVFISLATQPYSGFTTLGRFRKPSQELAPIARPGKRSHSNVG